MISYELAKKLKDSGFPFRWDRKCHSCEEEGSHIDFPDSTPSLSELIEACGDDFGSLETIMIEKKYFVAYSTEDHNKSSDEIFPYSGLCGTTPEEAVANLYLALQNK